MCATTMRTELTSASRRTRRHAGGSADRNSFCHRKQDSLLPSAERAALPLRYGCVSLFTRLCSSANPRRLFSYWAVSIMNRTKSHVDISTLVCEAEAFALAQKVLRNHSRSKICGAQLVARSEFLFQQPAWTYGRK
jgi:hypothetical protein